MSENFTPTPEAREKQCPEVRKHTKCPDGYLAWHEWAERKAKTHVQVQCPGCGLWTIWKPRKSAALAGEDDG